MRFLAEDDFGVSRLAGVYQYYTRELYRSPDARTYRQLSGQPLGLYRMLSSGSGRGCHAKTPSKHVTSASFAKTLIRGIESWKGKVLAAKT